MTVGSKQNSLIKKCFGSIHIVTEMSSGEILAFQVKPGGKHVAPIFVTILQEIEHTTNGSPR